MRWQKARVIRSTKPIQVGREFWVKADKPIPLNLITLEGDAAAAAAVECNLRVRDQTYRPTYAPISLIELLPEFREDVEIIIYEDWIKGD